jgi:hypothetical protein
MLPTAPLTTLSVPLPSSVSRSLIVNVTVLLAVESTAASSV